jgi:hypothetical protein
MMTRNYYQTNGSPIPITKSKWICVNCKVPGSDKYQTLGKTYDVTVEVLYGEETASFIGDDGQEYLFFGGDGDFITLEEWRERQLNKIL